MGLIPGQSSTALDFTSRCFGDLERASDARSLQRTCRWSGAIQTPPGIFFQNLDTAYAVADDAALEHLEAASWYLRAFPRDRGRLPDGLRSPASVLNPDAKVTDHMTTREAQLLAHLGSMIILKSKSRIKYCSKRHSILRSLPFRLLPGLFATLCTRENQTHNSWSTS